MRRIVTCIIYLLIGFQCISQEMDSLRLRLTVMKDDTAKVFTFYTYGNMFVQDTPDSAAFYYNKGKTLAEKLGFKKGIAAYASYYIVLLNIKGEYNEALQLTKEALAIYKTLGDKRDLSTAYLNVGNEWQYLSDFQQAAENYLEAKKLAEETGDLRTQRIANNNLAGVFLGLGQFQKGKEYAEFSLAIAKKINSDHAVASSLFNIATSETYLKQYDAALAHYREIEEIGKRVNDYMFILDGWLGAAGAYSGLKRYAEAEENYNEVLLLSRKKEAVEYELYAYMGLADMLLNAGRHHAAAAPVQAGIAIAQKTGAKYELKDLYFKASDMEEKMGRPAEALAFWKKFQQLNDSVINEKNKSDINLIEAKYEFEKKQSQIRQLEDEKRIHQLAIRQKSMLNYALISGAAILLVISGLFYRNYRQKQKIQEQRISELETEKQLTAAEAVLKGEERERSRLAKDLHDGLGGMLSGIKYAFQTMKGNLIMTPENHQAFERSMDMLDSSIQEMRRVAHNMMPEALVKFGLNTALKDFCNDINQSGALKITYQSSGLENAAIDETTAITIYRIVQELVNNTIKHAGASSAIVQLEQHAENITLTVEDNGKGFDTEILQQSKGIGWSNIRSRIEFLKGNIDIKSAEGKGTSVLVELKAV